MLGIQNYQGLYKFQQGLLGINFTPPFDRMFTQRTLDLLDTIFDYKISLMAYLANLEKRTLSPSYTVHKVNQEFAEKIHIAIWDNDSFLQANNDTIVFSKHSDYQKNKALIKLFRTYGYADCLLQFIKYPNCDDYISYIMLFSEEKLFNDEDVEMISLIQESIALAQYNTIQLWNMKNQSSAIINCVNYFPVGIMLIDNLNQVTFTNKLAKQYLGELGQTDSRFYSTFYMNQILPNFWIKTLNFGSCFSMRIKNFHFSVVVSSNPGLNFANEQLLKDKSELPSPGDIKSIQKNVSTCVYIIRDDEHQNVKYSYQSFNNLNLTKREREIAELIAKGLSNHAIAEQMFTSANTVKIHVSNILKKAKVSNRIELINKLNQIELELNNLD